MQCSCLLIISITNCLVIQWRNTLYNTLMCSTMQASISATVPYHFVSLVVVFIRICIPCFQFCWCLHMSSALLYSWQENFTPFKKSFFLRNLFLATVVLVKSDGVVSEGQAVTAGGGADHNRAATAQPGQDEGNQEDLQVCRHRQFRIWHGSLIFYFLYLCHLDFPHRPLPLGD